MITHSQVLEIVALPMLVYDSSKSFKLDKNQTIEGFLGSTTDVLEKFLDDIKLTPKESNPSLLANSINKIARVIGKPLFSAKAQARLL